MLRIKYITKLRKYQKFPKENSVYKFKNTIVYYKILTFFFFLSVIIVIIVLNALPKLLLYTFNINVFFYIIFGECISFTSLRNNINLRSYITYDVWFI